VQEDWRHREIFLAACTRLWRWLTATVDISSPTRCYVHWPGTLFAGRSDRFFAYKMRRPEGGNHKGNRSWIEGKRRRDRGKLTFRLPAGFISWRTVVCPWVRQHWWVSVWNAAYLGDLCLITGTVIRSGGCALSSVSPWLCCRWAVRCVDILIFGACILWSYGTYCLTRLRVCGLDNARCGLECIVSLIQLWICVGLSLPEYWQVVIWLIGPVNCFTDYFD